HTHPHGGHLEVAVRGALSTVTRPVALASTSAAHAHRGLGAIGARAMIALFVASLGAGVAFAADSSLPDDALYSVKTASEDVRLQLADGPAQRVGVLLDIGRARPIEAVKL